MYLHLGQETVVRSSTVIGIFDSDNTTLSRATRDFLNRCEKQGRVVSIVDDIFKSYVLCVDENGEETVYLSQVATATLRKRAFSGIRTTVICPNQKTTIQKKGK